MGCSKRGNFTFGLWDFLLTLLISGLKCFLALFTLVFRGTSLHNGYLGPYGLFFTPKMAFLISTPGFETRFEDACPIVSPFVRGRPLYAALGVKVGASVYGAL